MSSTANEKLKALFSQMEEFISTKTVVGEPIVAGDTIIIPLIDVSVGMATGVSASKEEGAKDKDGGAGGMGAKMSPSAVLVVTNGVAQLVNVKSKETMGSKIVDMIPGILAKFNLDAMFNKKDDEDAEVVFEEIVIEE